MYINEFKTNKEYSASVCSSFHYLFKLLPISPLLFPNTLKQSTESLFIHSRSACIPLSPFG